MRNQGLTKAFKTQSAIPASRFVKYGPANVEGDVIACSAASDFIIGVSDSASNIGALENVDVALTGIMPIKYGATVTRGQLLMSDSTGRAIPAAAASGTNIRTAGIAMVSGVIDDEGSIFLQPGSFQG
jgi:hypothetical protein